MDQTMERAANFLPRVDEPGSTNEVNNRVVSLTAPASAAAEQYRALFYRLDRLRQMRPMKVIAVTSAVPGEGKTLTAVNLALTAARANPDRRILLVDADLRRSQVARYLGIRAKPGLSELLAGECEPRDVVRRFQATQLAVIAAGGMPEEPTQVLASMRMKQLLQSVRDGFEEIYIDLPPTLPFADAAILSHQADGVVLVIRANQTPMRVVHQAVEQLGGAPLVGCVLNGAEQGSLPYLKAYEQR
jgi:protein-tyrosine kinase